MVLRDNGPAEDVARRRARLLADAERRVEDATDAAMRQFLRRVQKRVTPKALTAAGSVPRPTRLFEVGEAAGWWEQALDEHVTQAVADVWRDGYFDTRDGELLRSSQAAVGEHLANVTDRLSRTATPTIPDRAMDTARTALADEMARGSSIRDTSQRLAAEFGWDEDAAFWRGRLAETDGQIDRLLDPIGPPGDPAREAARLHDPAVAELQARRSEAVSHIDRVESEWQTRSERIARTETTAAYNSGSLDAAEVERAGVKVWVATADDRTRDDHLDAAGQCVAVDDSFDVGGYGLEMPGDPSGPPELTINCRCTMVFADSCAEAGEAYGVDQVMHEERERRGMQPPEEGVEPLTDGAPPPFRLDADGEYVDSQHMHGAVDEQGVFRYDADRVAAVHDPYVDRQLAGAVVVDEPEFHLMGGGPASGKSTLLQHGDVELPPGHVLTNADDAKAMVPEYQRAMDSGLGKEAAAIVHEESSDMAKRLAQEGLRGGHNTVLDGTGDGSIDGLTRKIGQARANGARRVVADYVTVDTDEAVRRAVARGAETGRHVPVSIIRETHQEVSRVFPQAAARDLFDEVRLFDNNGSVPRLIYEKAAGVERVVDPVAYRQFLSKAD